MPSESIYLGGNFEKSGGQDHWFCGCQTLFLATSELPQWANDHSCHCGRDRGYTLVQ